MEPHDVVPQPPADASVGERGTCTRCGCRYLVVEINPIVLARDYDAYVEALHAHVVSVKDDLLKIAEPAPSQELTGQFQTATVEGPEDQ